MIVEYVCSQEYSQEYLLENFNLNEKSRELKAMLNRHQEYLKLFYQPH